MTINGLARLSALSPSTSGRRRRGDPEPGNVTVKKLCVGLEVMLIEFFGTAEFRALEQENR